MTQTIHIVKRGSWPARLQGTERCVANCAALNCNAVSASQCSVEIQTRSNSTLLRVTGRRVTKGHLPFVTTCVKLSITEVVGTLSLATLAAPLKSQQQGTSKRRPVIDTASAGDSGLLP